MSAPAQEKPKGSKYTPQEVTIRHGIFWYFAKEMAVTTDEATKLLGEKEVLVQRIANQNDTVTLDLESDYRRGVEHHAFWTEEELAQVRALRAGEIVHGVSAAAQEPLTVQGPTAAQLRGDLEIEDENPGPLDYDLNEFDEQSDLIEWLQGTGTFDGMKVPNGDEVIKAARNDPVLAKRLLAAEPLARGDQGVRQNVDKGLNKIIEGGN